MGTHLSVRCKYVCTKGMHISSLGGLELDAKAVSLSRLVRSEQEQKCIRNSRRDERFGRANGREGMRSRVQGGGSNV